MPDVRASRQPVHDDDQSADVRARGGGTLISILSGDTEPLGVCRPDRCAHRASISDTHGRCRRRRSMPSGEIERHHGVDVHDVDTTSLSTVGHLAVTDGRGTRLSAR